MTGGLMQLASLGKQDSILLAHPQVTFFQQVYKRHSPFSMEMVEEQFIGLVDFSETVVCDLTKVGDLIHTVYLKVDLPSVAIPKKTIVLPTERAAANANLTNLKTVYASFKEMLRLSYAIMRVVKAQLDTYGITYGNILSVIGEKKAEISYIANMRKYDGVVINTTRPFLPLTPPSERYRYENPNSILLIQHLDIASAIEDTPMTIAEIKSFIEAFQQETLNLDRIIFEELLDAMKRVAEATDNNDVFAWGAEIGHLILNKVEIEIGGKVIDTLDKHVLSMYASLRHDDVQSQHYRKMIGDLASLNVASTSKTRSTLIIPLPFWFCRYPGAALPAVFLKHHDIRINVTFENFFRCSFNANNTTPQLNSASLIVNYIFLGQTERTLFGNQHHTYLIEQHQHLAFPDLIHQKFSVETVLYNPVKDMVWVVRSAKNVDVNFQLDYAGAAYHKVTAMTRGKNSKNQNIITFTVSGVLPPVFKNVTLMPGNIPATLDSIAQNNISVLSNYTGNGIELYLRFQICDNPIKLAWIELEGHQRFSARDGMTFNTVQPYQHFKASPKEGVNVYSFALVPDELQPSGFLNMTRVGLKQMNIELDDRFYAWMIANGDKAILDVYARSMNLLRFEYGKAFVTFNI